METPRSEQAQTMSRSQASQLRLLISCWCADERASMPTRHGSSYKSHHHAMKKSAEKSAKQVNTALLATLRPASFQTNHSPACTNMKLLEEKLEFGHEADCKCSQAVLQIVSSLVYISCLRKPFVIISSDLPTMQVLAQYSTSGAGSSYKSCHHANQSEDRKISRNVRKAALAGSLENRRKGLSDGIPSKVSKHWTCSSRYWVYWKHPVASKSLHQSEERKLQTCMSAIEMEYSLVLLIFLTFGFEPFCILGKSPKAGDLNLRLAAQETTRDLLTYLTSNPGTFTFNKVWKPFISTGSNFDR